MLRPPALLGWGCQMAVLICAVSLAQILPFVTKMRLQRCNSNDSDEVGAGTVWQGSHHIRWTLLQHSSEQTPEYHQVLSQVFSHIGSFLSVLGSLSVSRLPSAEAGSTHMTPAFGGSLIAGGSLLP